MQISLPVVAGSPSRRRNTYLCVPEEELPYVFDRFYTTSRAVNPQGTGLGLFIANKIAQQHNADIRTENSCESGGKITVVFWKYRPGNNTM